MERQGLTYAKQGPHHCYTSLAVPEFTMKTRPSSVSERATIEGMRRNFRPEADF